MSLRCLSIQSCAISRSVDVTDRHRAMRWVWQTSQIFNINQHKHFSFITKGFQQCCVVDVTSLRFLTLVCVIPRLSTSLHPPRLCRIAVFSIKPTFSHHHKHRSRPRNGGALPASTAPPTSFMPSPLRALRTLVSSAYSNKHHHHQHHHYYTTSPTSAVSLL